VPTLRAPPALVRSHAGHFMDKPDNVISLINLATLRSLEERWGYSLDPLRFRANIYIDGARPWEEFDWIGASLRVGDAVMRVDRRNGRCGATNVDPWTGRRDRDLPTALRSAFGHKDLGVYLLTEQSGAVVVGDQVATPEARGDDARQPAAIAVPPAVGTGRFICRGCYYVYDQAAGTPESGVAPGTALAEVPQSWRCPDCGTDKGKFQPYLVMAEAPVGGG
jgi:GntR family transcriptional regulator/MocR family aminotransferase